MKTPEYLRKLEQTDPCDIEELVHLSRTVVADKKDLAFDSRDKLTELIVEKLYEGIDKRRADECD